MWGHKFYPGVVDEVVEGGDAYEIVWDDGDVGRVLAKNVGAAPRRFDPRRAGRRGAGSTATAATRRRASARRGAGGGARGAINRGADAQQPRMRGQTSRFTGVSWSMIAGRWHAAIGVRRTA